MKEGGKLIQTEGRFGKGAIGAGRESKKMRPFLYRCVSHDSCRREATQRVTERKERGSGSRIGRKLIED